MKRASHARMKTLVPKLEFGNESFHSRQGRISPRAGGNGGALQRQLLEAEGVRFDSQKACVDFNEEAKRTKQSPARTWGLLRRLERLAMT